jgi:hypothetical protein
MKKVIILLVMLFLYQPIFSQETLSGNIIGTVRASMPNEPIAGVNIIVVGTNYGTTSDLDGKFTITKIPVGTYIVKATILGYEPQVRTDVVVNHIKPTSIQFTLKESSIQLDGVSVGGEYFYKSTDLQISARTSTNEEIRRLPGGFEDVVRAISILPGVAQVQAGRNDLIVRGGSPGENLYIIDNIEVPNINHFGTQGFSGGPLSYINLDFVDNTTFSSGGFGVRYGDRLSSLLAINMRDGRKDRLGGKGTISASQFGLNLEGPINGEGSFLFSARRSYLDMLFKMLGASFVPEYWDFTTKATYYLSQKDEISFLGIAALDKVKMFNEKVNNRLDNSRILFSNQDQFLGGLSWRHFYNSGYITTSLNQIYTDYDTRQIDTLQNPLFLNKSYEHETSLRSDLVTQLMKSTELSVGVQAKFIRFYSKMYLAPFNTSFSESISVDNLFDTTAYKLSAYAQVSKSFDKMRITAGARADYFNLLKNNFIVAPRFSASYSFTQYTTLNASVGRYYQAPSYIWLVANRSNRELSFIGVNQYVVGLEQNLLTDTKISLEGYLKNYFDYPVSLSRPYLVLSNSGAGYGGSNEGFASFGIDPLVSQGKGTARGIEFFIQKKLSEIPCYGTVSISYNESEFKALDGISRPSSFDQRWIINLGGGYIFNEKWEFSTKFRLATGRPYTPFNSDGTQSISLYNSERIGINHSLDIRIDRRWTFRNFALITYIDIQNIYNRKPLDVPRFDYRKNKLEENNSIGILPSIGVSLEF